MADPVIQGAPVASNTLEGLIQANDRNLAAWAASDLLQRAPFLRAAYAQGSSNGTRHEFEVEVIEPGATFRNVNEGRDNAAGKSKTVTIDLKIVDGSFERDRALAEGYRFGTIAYMEREGAKSLRAAYALANRQMVRGTGEVETGFYGLGDFIDKFAPDMQIIKSASAGSSIYMGRFGEDAVSIVSNEDGYIRDGEIYPTTVKLADGKSLSCLSFPLMSWIGLQVAGRYHLARLANVPQSGEGTLDDDMLMELLALFPPEYVPNFILMSRADAMNLAKSRTATTPTGVTAPIPTTWDNAGYPMQIIVDNSVVNSTATTTTTTTTTTSGE